MKQTLKFKTIFYGIILLCVALFAILISQFFTLSQQRARLANLQNYHNQLAQEIEQAKSTLTQVSSEEYQEQNARKKGYGYPQEKRFLQEK